MLYLVGVLWPEGRCQGCGATVVVVCRGASSPLSLRTPLGIDSFGDGDDGGMWLMGYFLHGNGSLMFNRMYI